MAELALGGSGQLEDGDRKESRVVTSKNTASCELHRICTFHKYKWQYGVAWMANCLWEDFPGAI